MVFPILEGLVHIPLSVGVDRLASPAVLLVSVGKHEISETEAQDGALLGVVKGVVEGGS